jgi:DNA polymerase III subunit delta'
MLSMRADDALGNLKHAFESDMLAHAYIIIGAPREEGRELTEKVLELIFCSEKKKPCGKCRGCIEVKQHTHPDILWVEPQMKSRRISIEQIRDLQKQVFQTSFSGGWKACVLVGADRIGDQAANAFLKTLEEPPKRCIFFLLTDSPQFLLPTVMSRCQTVNVESGSLNLPDEWRQKVVEILSREVAAKSGKRSTIAAFGVGEGLLKFLKGIKETIEKEEAAFAEEEALDEDEETLDARVSSRYREARTAIMRAILLWHRDVLMLVCGMDKDLVFRKDAVDSLKNKAKGMTIRSALGNVKIIEEMNRQLERNIQDGTVLSFGFSRLN